MSRNKMHLLLAGVLCFVVPGILTAIFSGVSEDVQVIPTGSQPVETVLEITDEQLWVIGSDGILQQMDMDEYLTGVLLEEMPGGFEEEALKAQAVVARTYALRRNRSADKHSVGAVCMESSCCQGYCAPEEYIASGGEEDVVRKMKQAVTDTGDLVLTYGGELIEATYFSCSGGKTEDAQAVWGAEIPYLQAVESPGEEEASHYTDTIKFTSASFQEMLGDELLGQPGTWIKSVTYTDGGGVDTIKIGNVTYTGTTLRSLLKLPSTAFVITAVGDNIIITSKGFGHRVGMSQYGADAMAVQGSSFEMILNHYYCGTTLESWSELQ